MAVVTINSHVLLVKHWTKLLKCLGNVESDVGDRIACHSKHCRQHQSKRHVNTTHFGQQLQTDNTTTADKTRYNHKKISELTENISLASNAFNVHSLALHNQKVEKSEVI